MFELEKAITEWKKGFNIYPDFEAGLITDMELHLRAAIDDLGATGVNEEDAFRQALGAIGDAQRIAAEYGKNRELALNRRKPWRIGRFMPALLASYCKVVWRKMIKQKGYSFINIASLSIGFIAFLLITLYCQFERSYDTYQANGERTYRIENVRISATKVDHSAGCPPALGPNLKKEYPEVAAYARLFNVSGDANIVSRAGTSGAETRSFYEKRVFFADPSFLSLFSIPMVQGDAATALAQPEAVVLTETTARKYFARENPMQQTVSIMTKFGRHDYRVAGVCRDLPANTHLKFDLLLSYNRLASLWPALETQIWKSNCMLTYIALSPTASPASLAAKFPALIKSYQLGSAEGKREFHLQPVQSIHLNSHLRFEAEVNGDGKTIVFLELISLFILLIAWANCINLATARSLQRGKEVCVRKTLGAERRQLISQFLFESALLNTAAFLVSIGTVWVALPYFGQLVNRPLMLRQLGSHWIWLGSCILAGSFLSGLYPALILSSFRPAFALRGTGDGNSRGGLLRKGLVLVQFTMALSLIAATLIVSKQLNFMRHQDLGADIGQTVVVKIPQVVNANRVALAARAHMASLANIKDSAISLSVPGKEYPNAVNGIRRQNAPPKEGQALFTLDVDERYFTFFNIPLLYGRTFSDTPGLDKKVVVINQEAVRVLGFKTDKDALLQNIDFWGEVVQIIGIVRDYHHKSMRDKIEPVLLMPILGDNAVSMEAIVYLSLKIQGQSVKNTVADVEKKWKTIFPGEPFEFFFLDAEFSRQYDADTLYGQIFSIFSLLAILIASLGLFGLASYSAARRTREIAIRKVLGASLQKITLMLAWEFARWVLLANVLGWPLAYMLMKQWQQGFAYRAPFGIQVFLLSGLVVLTIALLTVIFQALRAARANPAMSLKQD